MTADAELEAQKVANEAAQQRLSEQQEILNNLQADANSKKTEAEKAEVAVAREQEILSSLQVQEHKEQNDIEKLEQRLEAAKKKLLELQQALEKAQKDHDQQQQDYEAWMKTDYSLVETERNLLLQDREKHTIELAEAENMLTQLKADAAVAHAKYQELFRKLGEAKRATESAEAQFNSAEQNLKTEEVRAERSAEQKYQQTQQDFEKAQKNLVKLKQELSELQVELAHAQENKAEWDRIYQVFMDERYNPVLAQRDVWRKKIEEHSAKLVETRVKLSNLERQKMEAGETHGGLDRQLYETRTKARKLEGRCYDLERALKQAQEESQVAYKFDKQEWDKKTKSWTEQIAEIRERLPGVLQEESNQEIETNRALAVLKDREDDCTELAEEVHNLQYAIPADEELAKIEKELDQKSFQTNLESVKKNCIANRERSQTHVATLEGQCKAKEVDVQAIEATVTRLVEELKPLQEQGNKEASEAKIFLRSALEAISSELQALRLVEQDLQTQTNQAQEASEKIQSACAEQATSVHGLSNKADTLNRQLEAMDSTDFESVKSKKNIWGANLAGAQFEIDNTERDRASTQAEVDVLTPTITELKEKLEVFRVEVVAPQAEALKNVRAEAQPGIDATVQAEREYSASQTQVERARRECADTNFRYEDSAYAYHRDAKNFKDPTLNNGFVAGFGNGYQQYLKEHPEQAHAQRVIMKFGDGNNVILWDNNQIPELQETPSMPQELRGLGDKSAEAIKKAIQDTQIGKDNLLNDLAAIEVVPGGLLGDIMVEAKEEDTKRTKEAVEAKQPEISAAQTRLNELEQTSSDLRAEASQAQLSLSKSQVELATAKTEETTLSTKLSEEEQRLQNLGLREKLTKKAGAIRKEIEAMQPKLEIASNKKTISNTAIQEYIAQIAGLNEQAEDAQKQTEILRRVVSAWESGKMPDYSQSEAEFALHDVQNTTITGLDGKPRERELNVLDQMAREVVTRTEAHLQRNFKKTDELPQIKITIHENVLNLQAGPYSYNLELNKTAHEWSALNNMQSENLRRDIVSKIKSSLLQKIQIAEPKKIEVEVVF